MTDNCFLLCIKNISIAGKIFTLEISRYWNNSSDQIALKLSDTERNVHRLTHQNFGVEILCTIDKHPYFPYKIEQSISIH